MDNHVVITIIVNGKICLILILGCNWFEDPQDTISNKVQGFSVSASNGTFALCLLKFYNYGL